MTFTVKNQKNRVIAGFIAATLALLVAFLLILSHRTHAILADLSEKTDQAIKIGAKIHAAFSREVAAIVGFQATGEAKYIQLYQAQNQSINTSLGELERLMPLLGPAVQSHFGELKSAIDAWHGDAKTNKMATQRLPTDEFRQLVFDRLYVVRHAQETTTEFNNAIVAYGSTQRARLDRLGSLFRTLAVVFGPLALLALMLIAHILRRLDAATSHLESRAREEEALRQVGHSLTGGLTLDDVLRRITQAAAVAVETEGVFIETVDARKAEITCVAAHGIKSPAKGTKNPFEGSILQEVLQTREPQIIDDVDIERRPCALGELARSGQHCTAMVIPLIAETRGLGAIFLIRIRHRPFTYAEFPKLRILADMASVAMLRAQTVEKVQKMEAEAHFLAETSKLLASSLDYTATLKSVARLAVPTVADWCVVHLVEHGRIYVAELVHSDPAKNAIVQRLRDKYRPRPDRANSVERVIQTGKAQLTPEVTDELLREHSLDNEHFDLLRQLNLKSAILVPLTVAGEIFGSMGFLTSDERRYDVDDLPFAEEIARHAGMAIHNARLYTDAQHAIRARDEVLRMVSHDLRNPVSAIQMTANLLATASLPDEKRQRLLQMISHASQRMNRLIEDLMTIGRLQEGLEIPLDVDQVNPAVIADEVCEAIGLQALAKSIDLRCNKPATVPAVKADRRRIFQVLSNLLDNALKFTPEGGDIVVSCEGHDGEVWFAVKDTGRGINPKDLDKIFNPFWQAKPGAYFGAGLGLAIAKGIVEQHNGRIWADSTPGVGTTVFFTLPQADIGEEPLNRKAA
jgi:signal transduction histidine kinase